ncbi:4-hydroxy-tetrahydrodipicolinate synthase [Marinilactibacillus psychrotolerans]|uniref:4-hydroxy-tetrahydrodipicolinate synthase n=1 Tax=Marinilactibacillus psychrotolerans TaxID=191770 RepID=UPI003886BE8A
MKFEGIITAMVTPLNADETINLDATEKLVNQLIEAGVNGLFILGTNGEAHLLSEKCKLIFAKKVVETAANRVPVIVGVGMNSTTQVIKLSKEMEELKADALSIITPYFVPVTQQELVEHYRTIADATTLPILLYNMPSNTGVNIEPQTVLELSEHKRIVGIKDSSGDFENMKAYLEITRNNDEFYVLSGSDSKILDLLEAGGNGGVTALSNVIPETFIELYESWKNNKLVKAQELQASIEPLRNILKSSTIPSSLKYCVTISGLNVGRACKPILDPTSKAKLVIEKTLKRYDKNE